jgi:hypothetical protein
MNRNIQQLKCIKPGLNLLSFPTALVLGGSAAWLPGNSIFAHKLKI